MSKKFVSDYGEDSIGRYFKDVKNSTPLTCEEEVILAERIKEGDIKAMRQLVEGNLKFVISIAKEYQNQGLPLADLINEGNYGIVKAATRFDPTRGFKFISYAVWWIRQSILLALGENSRMIRLPINVIYKLYKVKKELEKFGFENERDAFDGELIGYDSQGEELKMMSTPTVSSLNTPTNDEGGELIDLISDQDDSDGEAYSIDDKVKSELNDILGSLDDRERDIIESYFGINTEHTGMTLDDIGVRYELTKERIRQIKEKALRKLRHNSSGLFELLNH